MFSSLRLRIEAALAITLLICMFLLRFYYNKFKEEKAQKQGVEQLFSKKQAEVELYKNHNGQLVAKNEAVTLENKTINDLVKQGNLQFLKDFDNLKKNYRNLEFAYQVKSIAFDSLMIKLNKKDTTYIDKKGDTIKFISYNWDYKDKWSKFDIKQLTPDSAKFEYRVEVPLDGVLYWKRKWFLGKKKYYSEVISENPHVKIPQLLNLRIGKKK